MSDIAHPTIACWRIKHCPAKRLAAGQWQDGPIDPDERTEYQRLGWAIETAIRADAVAELVEAAYTALDALERHGLSEQVALRAALWNRGGEA